MNGIFEDTLRKKAVRRVCRVAYTLNNAQPVMCSIISDQPVFYMDAHEACDIEDTLHQETLFDLNNLRSLESEIETLQRELKSLQRLTPEYPKMPDARFAEILSDAQFMTHGAAAAEHPSIENLIEKMARSRMAKAYLDCAALYNVGVRFSAQVPGAAYEREAGLILLNPHLTGAEQTILLARELRRHWQHRQGALLHPLLFHPDHAILVNRLQVADLAAGMVRVAWELQLSGDKDAWDYIENSGMADLGRAFAREAYLDFRTLNNGQAAAALVETWFLSERCRSQDKMLIRQMLSDYHGYIFSREQAAQTVTPSLIAALGQMPYGSNYLSKHAQTILADPIFTETRDRSNANFLWFIKFEQAYKETEETVQKDAGSGLPNPVNNYTNKARPSDGNPADISQVHARRVSSETAEIICFATKYGEYGGQYKSVDNPVAPGSAERPQSVGRVKQGASAQIVSFSPAPVE